MALLPGGGMRPPQPLSLVDLATQQALQDPRQPKTGNGLARAAIIAESVRRLLAAQKAQPPR